MSNFRPPNPFQQLQAEMENKVACEKKRKKLTGVTVLNFTCTYKKECPFTRLNKMLMEGSEMVWNFAYDRMLC